MTRLQSNDAKDSRPLVSIAMPAYNEQLNIASLFKRVSETVAQINDCRFEMIVIDNCSTDDTEGEVRKAVSKDSRWRYIRFTRNFGAESSLACALEVAEGDALILLQSDLQDPPELMKEMIDKWREGYDVVYGVIARREDDSLFKTIGAKIAYCLIEKLSDIKIPPNSSDFRIISRRVIDSLKLAKERNRYMRGLVHWVGFRQLGIPYERAPRQAGTSSAGLLFSINFAITGLLMFSIKPIRYAGLVGLFSMLLSLGIGMLFIIMYVMHKMGIGVSQPPEPGWMTIVCLVVFFFGLNFLLLGVIGEYLSMVFTEVKQRPLWIIDREFRINKDNLDTVEGDNL